MKQALRTSGKGGNGVGADVRVRMPKLNNVVPDPPHADGEDDRNTEKRERRSTG